MKVIASVSTFAVVPGGRIDSMSNIGFLYGWDADNGTSSHTTGPEHQFTIAFNRLQANKNSPILTTVKQLVAAEVGVADTDIIVASDVNILF